MADIQAAILQLQTDWFVFHDLDRARATAALRRAGASIRKIASGLHFSESLLRHLLWTLKATPEDQALARQNQISTNELVRRAKDRIRRREIQRKQAAQQARQYATRRAADEICSWLVAIRFTGPTCELIVEEVRREFADRERNGNLPAHPLSPLPPLPQLIERSRPDTPDPGGAESITWYAQWLCRWTFFAFSDPYVRDKALQCAAEKQWKK